MSEAEAEEFIAQYFEKLPGLGAWMVREKALARERGYTETISGRRFYYPDLRASKEWRRAAAERQAINAIIQGSAADLFRRAIVAVHNAIIDHDIDARPIVPVHDELLIEVHKTHVRRAIPIITHAMEHAMDGMGVKWTVPIIAEAKAAKTWKAAK
jgi:DNA polymerase-1